MLGKASLNYQKVQPIPASQCLVKLNLTTRRRAAGLQAKARLSQCLVKPNLTASLRRREGASLSLVIAMLGKA